MESRIIDAVIARFPREVQKGVRSVWESLSPAEKNTLEAFARGIPSQTSLVKMLIKMSSTQLKHAFGDLSRVAIVGPANVGKSTLYNQLVQSRSDHARVSPIPGTTRINQEADAGLFTVVDTPGTDALGEAGEVEKEIAMSAALEADFLIILFDVIQGIKKTEKEIFEELAWLGKPFVVVLNKIDLVKTEQAAIQKNVAAHLGLEPEQVIPISARSNKGIDQLLVSVAAAEPRIVSALGRAMPEYRWQLARRSIISAASLSAVIALIPLPVVDFAPLVVNQTIMVLGIARIYDYKINLERARELVVTFGLGFMGRVLFQELSKLGGLPGWLLSAAIAASTTVVMGYAAAQWFGKGEKVSQKSLNRMAREITSHMLDALKNLGKKRPGKEKLREAVEESLMDMDIAG